MIVAVNILRDLRATGHTVRLDGDTIRIRPAIPPEKREELRPLKPELVSLLKRNSGNGDAPTGDNTPENIGNIDVLSPSPVAPPPRTYTRLELAGAALAKLIPDVQTQRRIRALAEADARGWRFLGTDGYQHVLAGSIIDAVESQAKCLICFTATDRTDRFSGWFTKEIV